MYDPEIGRFMSPDTETTTASALSYNPYLYCANNPISNIDPSGKSWKSMLLGFGVFVAVAGLVIFSGGTVLIAIVAAALYAYTVNRIQMAIENYRRNNGRYDRSQFGNENVGALGWTAGSALLGEAVMAGGYAAMALIAGAGTSIAQLTGKSGSIPLVIQNATKGSSFEKAGLAAMNMVKNTASFFGRIPDAIKNNQIYEFKNVQYLTRSPQLNVFFETKMPVNLVVRSYTKISSPLMDMVRESHGKIIRLF